MQRVLKWHHYIFRSSDFNCWFIGDIVVPTYTVANAPSASDAGAGTVVFVSNGAAGAAILAFSDGTNWKRSDTGGTIAAA